MLHALTFAQSKLANLLRDRKAVSATEYTLMIVGIAALVLAGARVLGSDISTALTSIGAYLSSSANAL